MPSNASLALDLAGSALMSYGFHKMTKAADTGMEKVTGEVDLAGVQAYNTSPNPLDTLGR